MNVARQFIGGNGWERKTVEMLNWEQTTDAGITHPAGFRAAAARCVLEKQIKVRPLIVFNSQVRTARGLI